MHAPAVAAAPDYAHVAPIAIVLLLLLPWSRSGVCVGEERPMCADGAQGVRPATAVATCIAAPAVCL